MLNASQLQSLVSGGRVSTRSVSDIRGNKKLGVLRELPGVWSNTEGFEGHAWNMIALPFGPPNRLGDFRLLLNQGNEVLSFNLVDLGVPNRGVDKQDQHLAALRYSQEINQIMAADAVSLPTGGAGPATNDTNDTPKGDKLQPGDDVPDASFVGIHREPGLFLHIANLAGPCAHLSQPGPDVARLASIPHGDAVLAMGFGGSAEPATGAPDLTLPALKDQFDPLPVGLGTRDLNQPYFAPYKHFRDKPFKGNVTGAGFPGFDPTNPLALLNGAIQAVGGKIKRTTTFTVDSREKGGIQNIPFIVCQANATRVTSTFWIQEVDLGGKTRFVLQYAQRVILEFFDRIDGVNGLIEWPHISINTLIRQED